MSVSEPISLDGLSPHRRVLARLINAGCVVSEEWQPAHEEDPGDDIVEAGRDIWPAVETILQVRTPSGAIKQLDYFSGNAAWRLGDHEADPARPVVTGLDLDQFSLIYMLGEAQFFVNCSVPCPMLDPTSPNHLIMLLDFENTRTTSVRTMIDGSAAVPPNFRAALIVLHLETPLDAEDPPVVLGAQVVFYPARGENTGALLAGNQGLLEPKE